jgi:hypothetical protein
MRSRLTTFAIAGVLLCTPPIGATPSQAPAQAPAQAGSVTTGRMYTDARLGLTAVETEVELPSGRWQVAAVSPATAISQAFLMATQPPDEMATGRTLAAETKKVAASVQWRLQYLFEPLSQYAATHKGIGPKTLAELDPQQTPFLEDVMFSPWPQDADRAPRVPYSFLVPGARLQPKGAPASSRTALVLELRPLQNDGRHWVLFSNGEIERVPIDGALVAKYKLTIDPVQSGSEAARPAEVRIAHKLLALRRDASATSVTVTLRDTTSSAQREVRWTLAGGQSDPSVLGEWAVARAIEWYPLAMQTHSPILQAWLERTSVIYGEGASGFSSELPRLMRAGMEGRSPSAFDLLGGRAAMRETLQLELMRTRGEGPPRSSAGAVSLSTLKTVDVVGLPFDQMLAGRPGGRIALADFVPEDRLFIYFAKPSAVFPFLSQGGDTLGRSGSTLTATAFDDDLKRRYLRRLGLPEESSRKLLESGAITELAITAPDLLFLDGTDLTVLMRLRAPEAAAALAALAGVNLTGSAIVARPTTQGRSAYWARQGDVLALSTSRREVEQALKLGPSGTSSLGRSAELRYMLTELPLKPETRAIIYLSDPFIRRMVGPQVKIGQLRRVRAAAEMTIITAGALLYRLDGRTDTPDLATLARLGYVPQDVARPDYRLQPDLSVLSQKWGTLADLTTIETAAMETATQEEAEAYRTYVDEYRRYWRQYFDPIAMRLDDAPDGALEMTTFILPLIDSEMYKQLAGVVGAVNKPLKVPHTKPEAVLQLSLNLSDDAWGGISSGFRDTLSQFTGISAELFDLLGPGLHIAVQDADPVITFGTSDLLGAFGTSSFGGGLDMAIPFALSLLTRPCKIFLELQDAPRALELMRRAASFGGPDRQIDVSFRQIGNRDAWTYTFGVPGVMRFRLGLEIQNGYLVVSNIPWSDTMTIDRVDTRTLNGGAIQVRPDAVKLGLASLFATQAEQDQSAALTSMAALYPLLRTVASTPAEAAAKYAALFGTTPLHPGAGDWVWANGQIESTVYGSPIRWRAPAFDPARPNFGLFDGASLIDLTMQFEQGGLRAIARWRWR